MPDQATRFAYIALDSAGKRVASDIPARDRDAAFDQLRAQGLSPLEVRAAGTGAGRLTPAVSSRALAAFVNDLAVLLGAGVDIRSTLAVAAPATAKPAIRNIARQMSTGIAGGQALDTVIARAFPARHAQVAALAAAGAAAGDVAGGLERAAKIMESRLDARDRLIGVLGYPATVLVAAILALLVIFLFVIPSIAPLAEQAGAAPGGIMTSLIAVSTFLRVNGMVILGVLVVVVIAALAGGMAGFWAPLVDRFLMFGPLRRTVRGLTYGAFAVSLGSLLDAGAPMTEALHLAGRTVRSPTARKALGGVLKAVRGGEKLSIALGRVTGVPDAIVRMTGIGEQSAAVGQMLVRAGELEQRSAFRRIEVGAKVLGPALIVVLGALVAAMMGGLLSGLSGLGEAALE